MLTERVEPDPDFYLVLDFYVQVWGKVKTQNAWINKSRDH